MSITDNIKRIAFNMKMSKSDRFDLIEFTDFMNAHTDFVTNGLDEIKSAIQYKTTPSSDAINKLFDLRSRISVLYNSFTGEFEDGIYLQYNDLIAELEDTYSTLVNAFYLMGYSDTEGFSSKDNFKEYTIRQYDTLFSISKKFYGTTEQYSRILQANPWLADLSPEQYRFKVIKIPVDSIQKTAVSSNIGQASWGADLSNYLEIEDGDLKVLSFKDSFVQDITNIVCYGINSVPEDSSIGNAFLNQIGVTYLTLNPLIAKTELETAIRKDTAVDTVSVSEIHLTDDAITAKVLVKPINSEQQFELVL